MAGKGIKLTIGSDGRVLLPKEALDAIDVEPGAHVKLFIDTRRRSLRIERHVDDVWGEALKKKDGKSFDDILAEQKQREKEAEDIFRRGSKDAASGKKDRDPENHPDRWR